MPRNNPLKGLQPGSQFRLPKGSTIKQYIGTLGTGVASSFDEAIARGVDRFKDKDNVIRVIQFRRAGPVTDTGTNYQIGLTTEQQKGKSLRPTGSRLQASEYSTGEQTDLDKQLADLKRGVINRKGQQYHHMMSLKWYSNYFKDLDYADQLDLISMLNSKGFYPGDDRRNYIGLIGSPVRGSEHQGLVHPLIDRAREARGIDPKRNLSGLSVADRFQEMIVQLEDDRRILQEVIRSQRRPNLQLEGPDRTEKYQTRAGKPRFRLTSGLLAVDPVGAAVTGSIEVSNNAIHFLKKNPLPSLGIGDVAVSGALEYLTNPDATLGDSLIFGAVDAVAGQIESGPLSPVEMTSLGNGDRVAYDPTRNKVMPTRGVKESNGNKGIAYENGEAKLVKYGSVAGIKPDHEILAEGIVGVAQASASKIQNNLIPELLDAPFEIIDGAIKFVNGH